MKEYITSRYLVGAIVRNKRTNEDGKIDSVHIDDDCRVRYSVHIPMDANGWEMGTKAVDVIWDEDAVETSPNQFLN